MNNAKMWLVVSPSVGVPIFLGAVAVGSFAVHVAVLSNTSWVSDFLSGVPMGTGDATEAALRTDEATPQTAAEIIPAADGSGEFTIVMPDGTRALVVLQPPEVLASAQTPRHRTD